MMESSPWTILAPVILLMAGYLAVVAILAFVAHPLRRRMIEIAEEMLAEPSLAPVNRDRINHLLDTCMSFRVGLRLPFAILSQIIDDFLRLPLHRSPSQKELMKDERYTQLLGRYSLSVLAANPLAAIATSILIIPGAIIHVVMRGTNQRDGIRRTVEQPVLAASAIVDPCGHAAAV